MSYGPARDVAERIDGSARERDREECYEFDGASPMLDNKRRADEKWGLD